MQKWNKHRLYVCAIATSLLYVAERLDIIAKQAALQFVVDSLRTDVRIGSDAFCVRLLLSTTGDVKDVQIYHGVGVRDLHITHVTESRVSFLLLLSLCGCPLGGRIVRYTASVCLCVCPITTVNLKMEHGTELKLWWEVTHVRSICQSTFEIKGLKVKVTVGRNVKIVFGTYLA